MINHKRIHIRDAKSGQLIAVRPVRILIKGDVRTYEYDGRYYDASGKDLGAVPQELLKKTPRPYDPRPRSEAVIRQEVLAETQAQVQELLAKERERLKKELQDELLKEVDAKANLAPLSAPKASVEAQKGK
jgi:hypothetical protein